MSITVSHMCAFLSWIEGHPGLASWVQAVGSIAAIFAAVQIAYWQAKQTAIADQQQRDAQQDDATKDMAGVLAAELNSMIARSERIGIIEGFRWNAEQLTHDKAPLMLRSYAATQNYTPIYDSAGDKISNLEQPLAKKVITIYGEVKGTLDTFTAYADYAAMNYKDNTDEGRELRRIMSERFVKLADHLEGIFKQGKEIVRELERVAGRPRQSLRG